MERGTSRQCGRSWPGLCRPRFIVARTPRLMISSGTGMSCGRLFFFDSSFVRYYATPPTGPIEPRIAERQLTLDQRAAIRRSEALGGGQSPFRGDFTCGMASLLGVFGETACVSRAACSADARACRAPGAFHNLVGGGNPAVADATLKTQGARTVLVRVRQEPASVAPHASGDFINRRLAACAAFRAPRSLHDTHRNCEPPMTSGAFPLEVEVQGEVLVGPAIAAIDCGKRPHALDGMLAGRTFHTPMPSAHVRQRGGPAMAVLAFPFEGRTVPDEDRRKQLAAVGLGQLADHRKGPFMRGGRFHVDRQTSGGPAKGG